MWSSTEKCLNVTIRLSVFQVHPDRPVKDLQLNRHRIQQPNLCDTSDQASCLVIMNALFVKPVWGHSVGGQLFQPLPENDRKAGQIVTAAIVALLQVSSSHQTPAGPSHWVNAHSATSAYLPVHWGAGGRRSRGLVQESLYEFICHVELFSGLSSLTDAYLMRGTWCVWMQESDEHPSHSYPLWTRGRRSTEFRQHPWFPGLTDRKWDYRTNPIFHVYVSSIITFCLITYFLFSKSAHLKWKRLGFSKHLCSFGCCCLTGQISQGKPKMGLKGASQCWSLRF